MKSPDTYGKAVYKHLKGIMDQLTKEEPNRAGYKRLLKDICDCMSALDKAAKGEQSKKS